LMGDVARGITSFRQGLREGVEAEDDEDKGKTIEGEAVKPKSKKK